MYFDMSGILRIHSPQAKIAYTYAPSLGTIRRFVTVNGPNDGTILQSPSLVGLYMIVVTYLTIISIIG